MASGAKMSYNHFQSGKFGGLPQASQKDAEVTQDMHLKMSKKIAQLTKVIYALNTKNDENETVLQALREQHEEEIQQILADTKQKVAVYKDRLDEESDHQATIEALQTRIAEHQSQQAAIEEQFSQYKINIREKQEKEREDYAAKLFDMSHEVLKAKKDFEDHIDKFNSWKERINAQHSTAVAELGSKHQREMEDLRSFQRNQDDTWLNQCAQIEEKFKDQIESLKSQIEAMEAEKVSLNEEYTAKLEKAKAFYEKELEALRLNQTQEHSVEVEGLKKEIDRLKGDFGANDKELRVQIDRLVRQLADTEDSLEASRKEQQILQAELAGRNSSSSELAKQLEDLREQLASQSSKLHSTETELAGSKQHVADLADELSKKSTLLGELEAHNMQKESIISSLRDELEKLRQQLTRVDAERTSLLSQQQSSSSEQKSQLQSLRQALEDMTVEKETQKQRFEKQIKSLQDELEKTEKSLKEEMALKLSEMEKSHVEARESDRKCAAEVLTATKQELKENHEKEMSQAKSDYEALQQEFEQVKADLKSRLAAAEEELRRMEQMIKQSEEGLGSASGQLKSMKEAAEHLRTELEKTRSELKFSKTTAASLQVGLVSFVWFHHLYHCLSHPASGYRS
ncbi:protein FAM184A [Aplysia californica]|uniref:Protein FAM184A n=1 Tax=Aplysia californica TaxID=6500 RepID=A0ABM1A812_APLCA|nr:protein FAM184A [Aplysia californica]